MYYYIQNLDQTLYFQGSFGDAPWKTVVCYFFKDFVMVDFYASAKNL